MANKKMKIETQASYLFGQLWDHMNVAQRKVMLKDNFPDEVLGQQWVLIPIPLKNAICMTVYGSYSHVDRA